MISDMYPAERRAAPMAFFALGLNIGIFAAFFFGGWLAQNYGWRATFQIEAFPGLVLQCWHAITASAWYERWIYYETAVNGVLQVISFMFAARAFDNDGRIGLGICCQLMALAWIPAHLIRVHDMGTIEIGMALALIIGIGGGRHSSSWRFRRPAGASRYALEFLVIGACRDSNFAVFSARISS